MNSVSTIRAFGISLIVLGFAMLIPFFVALAVSESNPENYLYGAIISLICGAMFCIDSPGKSASTGFKDAVGVVLLWWIAAPAFAAIPFWFELGAFDLAYFESVSALTTTGAWLSTEAAYSSASGMLWRALLQWIGGLFSLAIAAAIFIRPVFIGIDTLVPPFSRGDSGSYLQSIVNAVFGFFGIYLLLTLVCLIIQMLSGQSVLHAVVVSLSTVASGGMMGVGNEMSTMSIGYLAVIFPFIVLGGANFVLITRLSQGTRVERFDYETGIYFIAILVVGLLFWASVGAGDLDLIPAQIFNAASLFSTNGNLIGRDPTLAIALITVIIGGSAISTAGGFKIIRWIVIFNRSREEIRRSIVPQGVFGKSNIANEFGVWIHFLGFTMILGAAILIITFGGHSFELAATAAAATLANAGPILLIVDGATNDYEQFEFPIRMVLCLGMILGRLEAVAALAVFNIAFWRS